jgi:CBS domain-containing protein
MVPPILIQASSTIRDAASVLIDTGSSLLVIVDQNEQLKGVITQWDITRAAAAGCGLAGSVAQIMSREVISASLDDNLIDVVRKLEYHEISTIPIVKDQSVLGLISTDDLARRSLLPL